MDKEFNIKKIFKLITQILFDIIDSVVEAVQMDFFQIVKVIKIRIVYIQD